MSIAVSGGITIRTGKAWPGAGAQPAGGVRLTDHSPGGPLVPNGAG